MSKHARTGAHRRRGKYTPPAADALAQPAAARTRRVPLASRLLLAAAVLAAALAFGAALRAPFQFDDAYAITNNSTISSVWSTTPAHPPAGSPVAGRPVVNYSLALNESLNRALHVDAAGPNATVGFHVFNVLVHLCCGLLIFALLRRAAASALVSDRWRASADSIALVASALWLLHPIQTDAVDYVTQRTELLVSLCYVVAVYAAARAWSAARPPARAGWSVAAVAACVMGMASKEVMIGAPLVIMLYDRALHEDSWKRLLRARGALYASLWIATLGTFLIVSAGARASTVGLSLGVPWYRYLYTQSWAIAHYLRLVVWPVGLIFDYGQTPIHGAAGVPGAVLLTALAGATVVAWRRAPRMALLGSCFFILLAPSSSVIPVRTEMAAERRMYLALLPVIVAVVLGAIWLRRRWAAKAPRGWLAAGVCVIAAACGTGTWARSREYVDPEALWRDTVRRMPENPRAYDNLAAVIVRSNRARAPEAAALLDSAIRVDSTYVSAWANRAELDMEAGRYAEAKARLERALRIKPDYADAAAKLGIVMLKLGETRDGLAQLQRVAPGYPDADAQIALADGYLAQGNSTAALDALQRALSIDSSRAHVRGAIGQILVAAGRADEAASYLEAEATRGSASSDDLAALALAFVLSGRADEATRTMAELAPRTDISASGYKSLGRALLLMQRVDDGRRAFEAAVRLAPSDPEAVTRLGIADAASGDEVAAAAHFRRALALSPGYPPAQQGLAKLAGGGER